MGSRAKTGRLYMEAWISLIPVGSRIFDLTVGANTFLDDGYRQDNYNRRVRVVGILRITIPGYKG